MFWPTAGTLLLPTKASSALRGARHCAGASHSPSREILPHQESYEAGMNLFKDVEKRPAEIKLLTAPNVRSWDLNRLFYLVPKKRKVGYILRSLPSLARS